MKKPEIGELNRSTLKESVFKNIWPEFYSFLIDNYKDCKNLSEKLFLHYNNLSERPICSVCGSEVKFDGVFKGFRKCCSRRCIQKDPEFKNNRIKTNLERYGVKNPMQNAHIKDKLKQTNLKRYGSGSPFGSDKIKNKIKQTNLERYGVEHASQNESIKEKIKQTNLERYGTGCSLQNESIKEKTKQTNLERYDTEYITRNLHIKEKIKQTNLERYGTECSLQNESIKEKTKQTNLEKYGVEHAIQNENIKKKLINKLKENSIESHPDLIRYDKNGNWVCKCPHPECSKCIEKEYITHAILYYGREQRGTELCTKLLPIQPSYSTPELQIRNFLDSLNIEYKTNDRSIISPKELDIYIPSNNIAIEFNGSYWHSNKDKYYHQNKTKACYSRGILLIHIYEHEWNKDKESILSKLKDLLEGKEVDGIVSVKDYDKYTLSEPILIDCGNCQYWNEGIWLKK